MQGKTWWVDIKSKMSTRPEGRNYWKVQGLVGTFSNALIERTDNNCLEGLMIRTRVILASLLPALWLIASMDSLSDAVPDMTSVRPDSELCASSHGKDDCSPPFRSLEQSARRWSRRFNVQSGVDGFSLPAVVSQVQVPVPDQFVRFSDLASRSPGLANCWQFLCRTALEPRAPSSVS